MGILVGFNAGPKEWPPKDEHGPKIAAARAKALFWMWVWCAVATVAFTLQVIGCLAGPLRFLYLVDFRDLRIGFFGMCNNSGSQKCTPSLLKQTFEIASEIQSSQNAAADLQRLQNDLTFAPSALSMFNVLISSLWGKFWDGDEDIMLFYVFWFSMSWVTAIGLAFNAAWMNSFGTAALKHSQALANTSVSIGIAYILLGWLQFFAILSAGLIIISERTDWCDKATTFSRQTWKGPYLNTLAPKAEVRMRVVQKYEKEEDAMKH